MKPTTFITLYNTRSKNIDVNDEEAIFDVVYNLIKPLSYIPYDEKVELIHKTIKDSENSKYFTAERYRQFIINLVNKYTNIEMDKNGFDILSENKLLDLIVSTFKSEFQICNTIMQMCLNDINKGG